MCVIIIRFKDTVYSFYWGLEGFRVQILLSLNVTKFRDNVLLGFIIVIKGFFEFWPLAIANKQSNFKFFGLIIRSYSCYPLVSFSSAAAEEKGYRFYQGYGFWIDKTYGKMIDYYDFLNLTNCLCHNVLFKNLCKLLLF